MDKREAISNKMTSVFLYLFSFVLLTEWFYPLEMLTDTGHLRTFLTFVFLSFVLLLFNVRPVWSGLFKVLFIVYTINYFYYDASIVGIYDILTKEIIDNIRFIYGGDWTQLTNPFRSILLYGLLWLVIYLIDYWLFKQQQISMFVFVTIASITILDTFTPYDASEAIIRIVVASLALLSLLTLSRMDREARRVLTRTWYGMLIGMLVMSLALAYTAPKLAPQWPDPVPFLKSAAKIERANQVKQVGYSWDDSELGGPIVGNDRVVFTAEVEEPHYWKVETKDYYTGKGWELTIPSQPGLRVDQGERVPVAGYSNGALLSERQSIVTMEKLYPHIHYPYGVKYIERQATEAEDVDYYNFNELTEKIVPVFEGTAVAVRAYTVTYDAPTFDLDILRELTTKPTEYIARTDDNKTIVVNIADERAEEMIEAMLAFYTQLPAELPERTKQLAKEITEKETTWFDKATAIETYFGRSGYVYDQKNVALPTAEQDYVDQFLFETKRGYCDNYSTAMVVMLRSLGIPARWVKGYTEGDFIGEGPSGRKNYQVTSNHAHSWAEVWFPHVGWVPFEPTKGFDNRVEFSTDEQTEEETTEQKEEEKQEEQLVEEQLALEENQLTPSLFENFSFKKIQEAAIRQWKYVILFGGGLILFFIVGISTRRKWLPIYYLWRFKSQDNPRAIEKALNELMKQLARNGYVKAGGETLRDFAQTVDDGFATDAMKRYIRLYEKYAYKGKLTNEEQEKLQNYWKQMMRQTGT